MKGSSTSPTFADELAGRRVRRHPRGRDRRHLGSRSDRPDVRPHSDTYGRRTRHRGGQRTRTPRARLEVGRSDRGLFRGGQREGRDPGPHRRPRRRFGYRRRRHGGRGFALGSILQTTKLQLDRATALRESMSAVRRGGTLSLSGVYTGPIQAFPLGDLFDMQIQLRMGQANVRQWVDDILPLLNDEDPLGVEDLKTHEIPSKTRPWATRSSRRSRTAPSRSS